MSITLKDIQNNGVVGAGGAGFPTHVKLQAEPEYIIVNAAECEPLLHKDMQLLEFYGDAFIDGLNQVIKITNATSAIIGIKSKHESIIANLQKKITANIKICPMDDFYPAGDEITLIHQTTGRIVEPGQLPISQGCIVQNVETIINIALNKPIVEKFLTIAGEVKNPMTVKVPVGTTFAQVLEYFEITTKNYIIREGGMMMGTVQTNLDAVVTKRTGGLIILPTDHNCAVTYKRYSEPKNTIRIAKAACDQCNFCTELCPRYLLGYPVRPELAMRNIMFSSDDDQRINIGNAFCCECNLCTLFSCPEGLDPAGATFIEKRVAQEQEKWQGLPVKAHPMMPYRKVPTKKLMQRLDVLKYQDKGPLQSIQFNPVFVRIPLLQHIGATAKAVVVVGQHVKKYDLIGEAKTGISANIHASINGTVTVANEKEIVIERRL
ncbi:MAG: 4Fe-4S dicluster domain-containing protein [Phycisphaerae bacterium]|nr:4Fe-4S dicluster domain-containing protein [Phycisphaerae bacterium]